jgi:Cdc6-like AAA superfamily ATPase
MFLRKIIANPTPLQEYFYNRLSLHAYLLVNDAYKNTRGNNSSLYYGDKNIGKSTVLKGFCDLIPEKNANVIPVYVNNNRWLDEAIIDACKSRNIILNAGFKMSYLESILKEKNKFMFVVYDELEELYTSNPNDLKSVDTLWTINHLGSQPSGRFYTVLCGSSNELPALITCKHDHVAKKKCKLCGAGLPDLDGTKFPARYLPDCV